MPDKWKLPRVLSWVLVGLMVVQPALGLLFPSLYRDVDWIKAAWFGNDWVTLVLGAPLLAAGLVLAARGLMRGRLLWLGMLGYTIYNYAYYMLGATLNAFFPLYVAALMLALVTMILSLTRINAGAVAAAFRPGVLVQIVGGYLALVGIGLAVGWLVMWGAYIFSGRPTPIEPEAFKLVAALDLTLMLPALAVGGVLLVRRQAWGYVIAPIAGVQAALYLILLTVNSVVAIARGLAEVPGEVPVWGTLALLTTAAVVLLMVYVGQETVAVRRLPTREPARAPRRKGSKGLNQGARGAKKPKR